jgi:ribosomal-protein-alanine N-acetyltransferase
MTAKSNPSELPVLREGAVSLRAPRLEDAEAFAELMNDPITAEATEMTHPCSPQLARGMIEAGLAGWGSTHPYRFTVEAADGVGPSRYAGTVTLSPNGAAAAEIGFSIHPVCRGRRIASSATRMLVDWGFATLDIPAITWRCHVGNYASWRIAWRNGFSFDATIAAAIDHRGQPRDAWVATLKRDDKREPHSQWMTPKRIEVDDLVLRGLSPSDEVRYLEALADPESMRWLGTIPGMPRTPEAFRARISDHLLNASLGQAVGWTVADRLSDDYLASVSLFGFQSLDYKSAEVGYRTHPAARGRRVLSRSLRAVIAHAFTPDAEGGLGLDRISLGAGDGNLASQGVARSCGFTETGRDRQCHDLLDGSVIDLIRFDLLRSEFVA